MRVGIDSYSYHRLYGELRPNESPADDRWPRSPTLVLRHARALCVDAVFLETCYLPEPATIDAPMLEQAGLVEVGFSWGHPWPAGQFHGLDGGRSPGAEADLARWITAASRLGQPMLRITAGTPASRGEEPAADLIARLVDPMRRAADRAGEAGVKLALENHGDLRAGEILDLLARANRPNLGVCLDNVNLVRVGDEMLEGTRQLAPLALLVQLKDALPGDFTVPGGPVSTALGDGVCPLEEVVAILAASGFDGPACVEIASLGPGPVDELELVDRSIGWLRAHMPPSA